jgi:hypothetical protein
MPQEVEMSRYLTMLRENLKAEELKYLKRSPNSDENETNRSIWDFAEKIVNNSASGQADAGIAAEPDSKPSTK